MGGGSRTRIPTGVALSNRILEVLDIAIGVDRDSPNILTISVVNAKTKFRYSGALHVVTPSIVWGSCTFEAEFNYNGTKWKETFISTEEEKTSGGKGQTALLERVWDNIALQVGQNVVKNLELIKKNEEKKVSGRSLLFPKSQGLILSSNYTTVDPAWV